LQNWEVVNVIQEKISGSKNRLEDRPGFKQLLDLMASGQVNKVLISEVIRLGRRTKDLLEVIEFLHHRVSLVVYNYRQETLYHRGKVNSMAQFLITLLGDIGRMETETLSERTLSELEEARRKGKRLGRPKGTKIQSEQLLSQYPGIVKDIKNGLNIRKTAAFRKVAVDTVQ
jgi:DNA invertase Pin-like site-specific DNA recombinase